MRNLLVFLAPFLLTLANLTAGRLQVAVIQFPEEKTPAELASAFAGQSLGTITNSNRTMTTESYLKGGYVLFAQSLAASPGMNFASATRIKDSRADIEGHLGSGRVSVTISLTEGVKAGLRNFEKKNYAGTGPFTAGEPSVIGIKQTSLKTPSVAKGQAKVERSILTTVVVAQYTP
jgi:hypothetical protein